MAKGGRPSQYKVKYCQQLIEFFDAEPWQDKKMPHYDKEGKHTWTDFKRVANKLPTLRNFAKKIEVSYVTVYSWMKKHEEFLNAFTHAQRLRKWFIIENGLNGCYNPLFAKFTAINVTDMRDRTEQQIKDELTFRLILGPPKTDDRSDNQS